MVTSVFFFFFFFFFSFFLFFQIKARSRLVTDRTVQDILQAISEYAGGIVNEMCERFVFRQRKQEEGEAFDTFYNDLRVLSRACNFCSKCNESMLRDQLVENIR